MYTVHVLKVILDNLTIKKKNLNITGMFLILRSRSRNQLQGKKILDPETSQKNGSQHPALYTIFLVVLDPFLSGSRSVKFGRSGSI